MSIFIGSPGNDVANAALGHLIGFTGGSVAELSDGVGDFFAGGDGEDFIFAADANDMVEGGEGHDVLNGGAGNDTIWGNTEPNPLGSEIGDEIVGNIGDDKLYGSNGNDVIDGGLDQDILRGGGGADTLRGGDGNDRFLFSIDEVSTGETIDGGAGRDEISVSGFVSFISAAAISSIEEVSFGGSATAIFSANQIKTGLAANSRIVGDYKFGLCTFRIEMGADTLLDGPDFSFANWDPSDRVEIVGDADDEVIFGTAQTDHIFGNDGDDTLAGGVGADQLFGGMGDDVYLVDPAGTSVLELAGEGNDGVLSFFSHTLEANVENLTLIGTGSVNARGNELANGLTGNAGANILHDGGTGGSDTLRGLGGNDTYLVYNSGDKIAEGASQGGVDQVLAGVDFALGVGVFIEQLATTLSSGVAGIDLTGNALKQEIVGNNGANVLHDGGAGAADTLRGLNGNDIYRVFNSGDVIVESSTQGAADRVTTAVDYALGKGVFIELLTTNGSTATSAIDLTGNEIAQEILGNAGDNRLEGKGGSDALRGLDGNDTFVFATALGAGNVDTILDFNVADDRLLLSDAIFTKLNTGVMLSGYFRANTTGLAQDSNDHVIYETDTGKLLYDADGLGGAAGTQFAKLAVGLALTYEDFSVA